MIGEYFTTLAQLQDEDWEKYVFSREPLSGKLTAETQREMRLKSEECGRALARGLIEAHGARPVKELAELSGAKVGLERLDNGGSHTVFARFTEPDEIVVYEDNADMTDRMIDREGLREAVGPVRTADILLAHELYHYLACKNPETYTSQKHLLLWRLGPIKNESTVGCLEEIGAMAFAKELCGLTFTPYVLDVLMLYPTNPQRAKMVFDGIVAWSKT